MMGSSQRVTASVPDPPRAATSGRWRGAAEQREGWGDRALKMHALRVRPKANSTARILTQRSTYA